MQPSSFVDFISAIDHMDDDGLFIIIYFVENPPIPDAQLKKSFVGFTKRERRQLVEIFNEPSQFLRNSLLRLVI